MIIDKTNISTTKVATALQTSSRDIGTLCTHKNICMWSKWKPIRSDAETMTLQELTDKRYGLKVIEARTISALIEAIDANQGVGVYYERPIDRFRLGDFRNYNSEAPRTVDTTEKYYQDSFNGILKIGGVTPDNHGSYEHNIQGTTVSSTETTIGVEDLYRFIDSHGNPIVVRRGAYITDGSYGIWYTDKFYWWTTEMQKFKGKTVTIYEFYTNVQKGPEDHPDSLDTDRFYALPIPKYTLQVIDGTPAGSKIVGLATTCFMRDSTYQFIDCKLQFTAVDDIYRGNANIQDIIVSLYWDRNSKGEAIDTWKCIDSVYVPKGQVAPVPPLEHTFRNRPQTINGPLSPFIFFRVYATVNGNKNVDLGGAQVFVESGGQTYVIRN